MEGREYSAKYNGTKACFSELRNYSGTQHVGIFKSCRFLYRGNLNYVIKHLTEITRLGKIVKGPKGRTFKQQKSTRRLHVPQSNNIKASRKDYTDIE